jgi:hypothetical protein
VTRDAHHAGPLMDDTTLPAHQGLGGVKMCLYQKAPPRLRGLAKTLVDTVPVLAMRVESPLGVRTPQLIDTLF